jgi:hypothetical protein
MSVFDFLFDLFSDEEARTAMAADPEGYVGEHLPEGMTSEQFLDGVEAVCGELPPEQATVLRQAYGLDGPDGPGGTPSYPPAPPQQPGESDVEYTLRQINHYTDVVNVTNQSYEDNDTTVINDQDTNIDNSVNQDITAFGDVNQDFDNDVVTGDENALGGDGSQVNSGDGAVQAGGDIVDSTIATGDVEGSVTGDVYDSVVGDGNNVIDDSRVGAAAFGDGDAINAENVLQGDGTLISDVGGGGDVPRLAVADDYPYDDGEVNINTGSGDQTVVDDSIVSESAVGSGSVESNDIDIDASEGSAVAFGEGSSAEGTDTDITNDSGTVQVAGDDSVQIAETDNSVDASINDSFNTDASVDASINDSFNTEVDASINDSFDTDVEDNDTTTVVEDNDTTVEDNDFLDLDA